MQAQRGGGLGLGLQRGLEGGPGQLERSAPTRPCQWRPAPCAPWPSRQLARVRSLAHGCPPPTRGRGPGLGGASAGILAGFEKSARRRRFDGPGPSGAPSMHTAAVLGDDPKGDTKANAGRTGERQVMAGFSHPNLGPRTKVRRVPAIDGISMAHSGRCPASCDMPASVITSPVGNHEASLRGPAAQVLGLYGLSTARPAASSVSPVPGGADTAAAIPGGLGLDG